MSYSVRIKLDKTMTKDEFRQVILAIGYNETGLTAEELGADFGPCLTEGGLQIDVDVSDGRAVYEEVQKRGYVVVEHDLPL